MANKSKTHKRIGHSLILFLLIFSCFSLQAQNLLDGQFKENANKWYDVVYQTPEKYNGLPIESFYMPTENFIQSALEHGIKHEKYDIVVAFSLRSNKPDNTPRGIRIRQVNGDPNQINRREIAIEADTKLSKVKDLGSLELKKLNADRGVIYNVKITIKFLGKYARCKKIITFKDDVGRSEILFFYNKGDDAVVDEEIEKTWGILKFKS